MTRRNLIVYASLALYTVGPVLLMLLASAVASANGCQLNEAAVHPCVVWGVDVGGVMTLMFVGAWLAYFTLPTGALALIVFSIYVIFRRARRRTPPSSL